MTKPRRHPEQTATPHLPENDDEIRRRGVRGGAADEQDATARAVGAGIPKDRPEPAEAPEGE